MEYFFTIDAGTTSVKTALFDQNGVPLAVVLREYSLETPSENIVELDPEIYWSCAKEGIAQTLAESSINTDRIRSIGISSQGETLILLDGKGNPLMNAIVWLDNRSHREAEELKEKFGVGNTGIDDMIATWPITKTLWIKRNKPKLFENIHKMMMVEDYLIYRLTGQFVGEYSLYSSTAMLDIHSKEYWAEILDYIGIKREQLVELRESAEIVGPIAESTAEELGLPRSVNVTTGAMDQTSGMIGAGNIREGIITETTGSALAICKTLEEIPGSKERSVAVQCHAVPEKYLVIGWCAAGGLSLKWLRDTFFGPEIEEGNRQDRDPYELMTEAAEKIAPGSQGLIFYPFLSGPGTLPVDPTARGCFYGIELHHKKPHFVRAVLESVAFVLRENIERMETMGVSDKKVRTMGGGAKSSFWNQVKSDVTGLPVSTMRCSETALLGIAILSSVATGVYANVEEASAQMIEEVETFYPDEEAHSKYNEIYAGYRDIEERFFGIR
jgi:sugar (pentulose or hexulose) kinase